MLVHSENKFSTIFGAVFNICVCVYKYVMTHVAEDSFQELFSPSTA